MKIKFNLTESTLVKLEICSFPFHLFFCSSIFFFPGKPPSFAGNVFFFSLFLFFSAHQGFLSLFCCLVEGRAKNYYPPNIFPFLNSNTHMCKTYIAQNSRPTLFEEEKTHVIKAEKNLYMLLVVKEH